jgi:N-acylneuraminate cytidylyltransferase
MNIAIIPARGGSKRIPRKNIRQFAGKPMIVHSIEKALSCELFKHVVVSTDDREIAEIAEHAGAEVPFIRSAELADDHAATVPVIADAINRCLAAGWELDYVCCIYPCAPFLEVEDLVSALNILRKSDFDYCFPVTEYSSPIQRALGIEPDGRAVALYPEHELTRSQDLKKAFHDAGQFYWGSRDSWVSNPNIYKSSSALTIPNWRVVDIDTEDDWARAELMYEAILKKHG